MQPDQAHSWQPVDLLAVADTDPEQPSIGGLLYPGRRHIVSGETESLKTWLLLILCVLEILERRHVVWIDFEVGPRETVHRLRALGLVDPQLELFTYLQPDEPMDDPSILADIERLLAAREPSLIVMDAMIGALQSHKLDPNSAVEVEGFYRRVVDPLRSAGAAVAILDHLPKDTGNRGKFAIGSERKIGAADVHLGLEVAKPFGRGRTGLAKIITHKDRPGGLHRPRAAELEIISNPDGRVTWNLKLAQSSESDGAASDAWRPTGLMEKVSRYLEGRDSPTSRNTIETAITGSSKYIRQAIDELISDGYAHEIEGARGARNVESQRPYREHDLVATSSPLFTDDLVATSSLNETHNKANGATSSHLVPTSSATSASDLVPESYPPTGDELGETRSKPAAEVAAA